MGSSEVFTRHGWTLGVCRLWQPPQSVMVGFEAVCGPRSCLAVVGSPMGWGYREQIKGDPRQEVGCSVK